MRRSPPEVQFPQRIRGRGELLSDPAGEAEATTFEVESEKYAFDEDWNITAYLSEAESLLAPSFLDGHLRLEGTTERQQQLVVPNFHFRRHEPGVVWGGASRVELGVEETLALPDFQVLSARLSPTALALSLRKGVVQDWTGEMAAMGERDPFFFHSDFGRIEFFQRYSYEDLRFADRSGVARLPIATLRCEVESSARTKDVPRLLDEFAAEIADICNLLTLLSRRRVVWGSLHHTCRWDEGAGGGVAESEVHRHTVATPAPQLLRPLLSVHGLGRDALNEMLETWRAIPYIESVRKATSFLQECFQRKYLEEKAISAFTALETLTDGYSRANDLLYNFSDDVFRAFRSDAQDAIKPLAKKHGLSDGPGRDRVYRKLGELQWAPLVPRIVALVESTEVDWSKFWGADAGLEKELQESYARRSDLIHAGKTDHEGLWRDTFRIHALTEELIYHLAGGKTEWLHPRAYEHIQFLDEIGS